jgi:spermidine/putrescine transport system ATP-binding protein
MDAMDTQPKIKTTHTTKVELVNVIKEFPLQRGETVPVRAVDNVSMEIYDSEFFAMLGPSGCGKTTTLRMIAGFEQPTSGQILIDGVPMAGVPSFYRPVNTVFQDYALFPHMTVLQNVMFGLEMEKVPRREAEARAREALEIVRLPQASQRKPRELSGGMQQRVALARAIVKRPSVLLLDEPLGALDLKLRREMQMELKAMQQELGITFIYVTHDQEEALTMANRIAVMNGGEVLQIGRPEDIYEAPATRFVADFIGETNFLTGRLMTVQDDTGVVTLDEDTQIEAMLGSEHYEIGQEVTVAIRPEKIGLSPHNDANLRSEGDLLTANALKSLTMTHTGVNVLPGQITQMHYIGTDNRYIVRIGRDTHLSARIQNTGLLREMVLDPKQMVNVSWDKRHARILAR